MKKPKLKQVTSKEQYWEQHKIYSKKLDKLTRNPAKFFNNPKDYQLQLELTLDEMVQLGLITNEFRTIKLTKFYQNLSKPALWKTEVKDKIVNLKDKYSKSFKQKYTQKQQSIKQQKKTQKKNDT